MPRAYTSPRRTASAQSTRQSILDAALHLFSTRGYPATTREDIARHAGVAPQTVGAVFGPKRAILQQLLDDALRGADGLPPPAMRSWLSELREQRSGPELLRHHARSAAQVSARAGRVLEVMRRAAAADSDVAAAWDALQRQRLQGQATVVHLLAALAPLRPDLARSEAADLLWVLTDDALHQALVVERGWSQERYETWLGDTMAALLLG